MLRLLKRLVRTGAFVGKEIAEVRRQPRLVLSLILGPFLILFLFGIGYRGEKTVLSAMVVVPPTGGYSTNVDEYRQMVGNQVNIQGVTTDERDAMRQLQDRTVDIVVVVPADAAQQIGQGSQAKMPVYFNEVDPVRSNYIIYSAYLYTTEINKHTLAQAASQGQESAGDLRGALQRLRRSLSAVQERLDKGDNAAAAAQVRGMQGSSSNVQLAVGLLSTVLTSNTTVLKPQEKSADGSISLAEGQTVTARLNSDLRQLESELTQPNPDRSRVRDRLAQVNRDLDDVDKLTNRFQSINPLVLAAPFYATAQNKAPIEVSFTSFYAPAVLVLLLQHICVTLAALSVVRERMLGALELFRVSPVSPSEILVGKYISFTLLLGIIASVLLLLMSNELSVGGFTLSLGVPILGNYALLALSLAFVIFASAGLGFLIANVSKSESQAVQLAMLVLLTSVFFSGFFLRLETLWGPVRTLSYALPVTYGIRSMQDIMLRGGSPDPRLLIALLLLGVVFGLTSFILFSREFRRG